MSNLEPAYDVVIAGGGQAGGNLALALRRRGYPGSILLVGRELYPPYERPPLSKGLLTDQATPESTFLASAEEFAKQGIVLALGHDIVGLDRVGQRVTLDDQRAIGYGKIVLATGADPRPLSVPGSTLRAVFQLRSIADSLVLRRAFTPGASLVLIGGGTIGLEVASAAVTQGVSVTVIESADNLLPRLLPPHLAHWLGGEHKRAGIEVRLGSSVNRLNGHDHVEAVELADGSRVKADLVLCGIGCIPNTRLAEISGLEVDAGILTDARGRTSDPDVYAIGDVACQRDPATGRTRRIESWQNALQQSERLADEIAGQASGAPQLPWFWTDQLGHNIQVLGEIPQNATPIFRGAPAASNFTALYRDGARLTGAIAVNRGREMRALREIMTRGLEIPDAVLADDTARLDRLVKAAPVAA